MKLHVVIRVLWCAFLFLSFGPAAIIFLMSLGEATTLLENANALYYIRIGLGWCLIPLALIAGFRVKWLYAFSGIHLIYGLFNFLANGLLQSFLQPIIFTVISLAIIVWHKKQVSKPELVSELKK